MAQARNSQDLAEDHGDGDRHEVEGGLGWEPDDAARIMLSFEQTRQPPSFQSDGQMLSNDAVDKNLSSLEDGGHRADRRGFDGVEPQTRPTKDWHERTA